MSKIKPKKWTTVYPVGTKEGDEESRFFRSLARHPKYEWRSTSALSKESGLSLKRVEEIIEKYLKMNMIFQNPKNEDHWGYWERVPHLLPDNYVSAADSDKQKRIKRFVKNFNPFGS
jgi:hypothetical protein